MRHASRLPHRRRAQTLIIVACMFPVLLGFLGLGVDVAWFEINLARVQRAADAAALAGVIYLPANLAGATTAARNEAVKNGYQNGAGGVTVAVTQDPLNDKMIRVDVTAPVRTFFSRLFGLTNFTAHRDAKAEFILPVPMGSPQNYYGIFKLCVNGGTCNTVNDTSGHGMTSQGFWGAVISKGGSRGNGDLYSTFYNGSPTTNTYYDANGYSYIISFPSGTSGGLVSIFDAPFCATGKDTGGGGQQLGTGDHWIASPANAVTTEFTLWDMHGTPYDPTDDTVIATDAGLFTNENQLDKSAAYGGDRNYGGGVNSGNYAAKTDCSANPRHNAWWTMNAASPIGTGGQYRLQVKTSSANNNSTNAENMFGIMATTSAGGSTTNVYGQSRMCDYVNVVAGNQLFYLAQIAAVHAGKTLQITVHDPGDVGGNAFLKFEQPGGGGYSDATFSWTASGGGSGNNVTSLQVASGGSSLFDNQVLTITIVLPANYAAPTPPGEPGPGWWKVLYNVTGAGNDTATWSVNIQGNPVHLVVP